jgi:hypothetical protein
MVHPEPKIVMYTMEPSGFGHGGQDELFVTDPPRGDLRGQRQSSW